MRLLTLPYRLIQRFFAGQYSQTAAALSFATLLGVVPMIAVAASLLSHLPLADTIALSIQKFLMTNLLPDKAGGIIAKYVTQFAIKAQRLTWLGLGVLAVTAIAQMLTIERAFNSIWKVKDERPLAKRVVLHFSALMFAFIYWKVPNQPVVGVHALAGGLLAAAGFSGLHWLFASYISGAMNYRAMYGAFSAVPIFLLWLYLSWSVILLGALTTAELGGAGPKPAKRK